MKYIMKERCRTVVYISLFVFVHLGICAALGLETHAGSMEISSAKCY